jgi:soluble lytic murein transglycosylase-like protein
VRFRTALLVAFVLARLGTPAIAAPAGGDLVARYAVVLGTANPQLSADERLELARRVLLLSAYYSLDPRLLVAVVMNESGWRAAAVSPAGARGLGQLMPATAAELAVNALSVSENLDGTARYLRRLLDRYAFVVDERTRIALAVAAYNAGPEAVRKYRGIPPYAETRAYVASVLTSWATLRTASQSDFRTAASASSAPPAPIPPLARRTALGARLKPVATTPSDSPVDAGISRTLDVAVRHLQ